MQKYIFNIVCSEDTLGKDPKYKRVKLEHQDNNTITIKLCPPYFAAFSISDDVNKSESFDLWIEKGRYSSYEGNFCDNYIDEELYKKHSTSLENVRLKVILDDLCEYRVSIQIDNDEWITLPKSSLIGKNINLSIYYNKELKLSKGQLFSKVQTVSHYIPQVMYGQTRICELAYYSFPNCDRGVAELESAYLAWANVQSRKIAVTSNTEGQPLIYFVNADGNRANDIQTVLKNFTDYMDLSLEAVLLKNSNIREVLPELEISDDLDIDKRQLKCLLDKILMQNERILVNNPNLQEGIAKKLRENPGNIKGPKGDQGLKGDIGPVGPQGIQGPRGFNGTQGITGSPGQKGESGLNGLPGPQGLKGKDGIGAVEADQFLYEMNKTKLEIQNTQKAVESARNVSQRFAEEAHDAENKTTELYAKVVKLHNITEVIKKDAQKFASNASTSKQNTEALYGQVKNMFCGIKPTDPVCTSQRRTRKTRSSNNQPVTSGAGRTTSFISQIINFYYPSITQDKYKIENKIHELNQVVRVVDAANIVLKFEKVLEEAASRCGIPKKHLNLDPAELQLAIVSRSLLDDENRNEILKLLCETAKKSCPNYKQADKFLALFKDNMKKTLVNNEQQSGCVSTEETVTDNIQPRSFMSNIIPPTSISSISQMAVGYLR